MLLRLPSHSFLAIAAVIDIAINGRERSVAARDIATRFKLSNRRLEVSFQTLVQHGVLKSTVGPGGGYQLARAREKVTVYDIVQAVASLDATDPRLDRSVLIKRVVKPALVRAEEALATALSQVTIEEMARAAEDRLRR